MCSYVLHSSLLFMVAKVCLERESREEVRQFYLTFFLIFCLLHVLWSVLFACVGVPCCVLIFSRLCNVSRHFIPSKLYEILGNLIEGLHAPDLALYMYTSHNFFKIRFIKSTNFVAFITMVLISSFEVASYYIYKVIKLPNCRCVSVSAGRQVSHYVYFLLNLLRFSYQIR